MLRDKYKTYKLLGETRYTVLARLGWRYLRGSIGADVLGLN
jgi:hypothetical protein